MQQFTKLHSSIFHPTLRKWQESNVEINSNNLMYPLFIIENDDETQDIPTMPGVKRFGKNALRAHLEPLIAKGLSSVLLFGVIGNENKDNLATYADSMRNPVNRVLPMLRETFPNLVIACDVCLCGYTDHGHCGVLNDKNIDNEASIRRLAEVALSYATNGAHIVAPSDMMDNRVAAIKKILQENGYGSRVAVLSYAAKFASNFYGPFRDAANSAPGFGDRKCYQLPFGSKSLAIRAVKRDVEEGADMLMVKPGLPYLDIIRQTKEQFPEILLFVYQVSGEYALLYHGAKNGAIDLNSSLMEVLTSMRRSGADVIITYYTPILLDLIKN